MKAIVSLQYHFSARLKKPDIKGIKVNDTELKVSMLANDTTCFFDASKESFDNLFATLDIFGKFCGCKINMSKSGLGL